MKTVRKKDREREIEREREKLHNNRESDEMYNRNSSNTIFYANDLMATNFRNTHPVSLTAFSNKNVV